jgi:hypothetical protein
LKSLDITVLQAFVIYIVRDTETRRVLIKSDNCFRLAADVTIKDQTVGNYLGMLLELHSRSACIAIPVQDYHPSRSKCGVDCGGRYILSISILQRTVVHTHVF